MKKYHIIIFCLLLTFINCGGAAGTRVGNPPTETTQGQFYPTQFAVASPLQVEEAVSSTNLTHNLISPATQFLDSFDNRINEINTILTGSDCEFSIRDIFENSTNAECYGPEIIYENHPDSSSGLDDGTLPTGDTGIWLETNTTAEATMGCAAAQLNNKSQGLANSSNTALQAFAAMYCVIENDSAFEFPSTSGDTVSLAAELQTFLQETSDYEITTATLTLTSESSTSSIANINSANTEFSHYTYSLIFTDRDDANQRISMTLNHVPLDQDGSVYLGRISLSFPIDDPGIGNCPTAELQRAVSITYYKRDSDLLNHQANSATYCDRSENPFDTNSSLDPAQTYDSSTTPAGWGNDWQTFTANFDPETLSGQYVYLWQAGRGDSHARILNIDRSDELNATAYFGFGDAVIDSINGEILGMICNWAGPGNNHTPVDLVQQQTLSRSTVDDEFLAESSHITYAPTVSCGYDGTGTFTYDSDAEGSVDTDPAHVVNHDLLELGDMNFDLPVGPEEYNIL